MSVYRRHRLAALVVLITQLAGGCGARPPGAAPQRLAETRRCMGVPWTITVCTADRAAGAAAITAAFAEVERLERVLSDYDPTSELSRLSAESRPRAPITVSEDLWAVLVRAAEIANATDGAFDITVGPLTSLWRQSRRSGHLPRADKLAAARAAVGADAIVLDAASRTVSLARPSMRLDPGGIGMGFAADRALAALSRHGIASAMVDASGDVAVSAAPPGTAGWRIAVAGLIRGDGAVGDTLLLEHAAVTTSGDAHQAVEIDGRRYSHVVDPRTGIGVAGPAAVTVIAPDCTTADALATAANVLGPESGPAAIARFPGCSARFIWREGGTTRSLATPGWPVP